MFSGRTDGLIYEVAWKSANEIAPAFVTERQAISAWRHAEQTACRHKNQRYRQLGNPFGVLDLHLATPHCLYMQGVTGTFYFTGNNVQSRNASKFR